MMPWSKIAAVSVRVLAGLLALWAALLGFLSAIHISAWWLGKLQAWLVVR